MVNTVDFDCPLCGAKEYKELKNFKNGVIVGECINCKLVYTPLRDNNPEDLFGNGDYEIMKFLYTPILNGKVKHFRHKLFLKYINIIKKYSKGKSLLDIGCAHGFFTYLANVNGFASKAIEPNKNMCRFATSELNLDVKHGTFDSVNLENEKWDVITFTDSFEYFTDALQTLKTISKKHLNENGIVFIKVPNGSYFKFRHWLKMKFGLGLGGAEAFSPYKRVVHYTNKTLESMISNAGLRAIEIKHIAPIDSPVWSKYTGIWLELEPPLCLVWKQRLVRRFLHFLGQIEVLFTGMNHFSQSVYIIATIDTNA